LGKKKPRSPGRCPLTPTVRGEGEGGIKNQKRNPNVGLMDRSKASKKIAQPRKKGGVSKRKIGGPYGDRDERQPRGESSSMRLQRMEQSICPGGAKPVLRLRWGNMGEWYAHADEEALWPRMKDEVAHCRQLVKLKDRVGHRPACKLRSRGGCTGLQGQILSWCIYRARRSHECWN